MPYPSKLFISICALALVTAACAVEVTGSSCRTWDDDPELSLWTFELPDAPTTLIGDINRHGTVAAYTGSIPDGHASFLVRLDGSIEPIEVEGSKSTVTWVINDAEMVAGAYWPSSGEAAGFVRLPDGVIEKFAMPEAARFVDVGGANERGDIFGSYHNSAANKQWYTRTVEGTITKVHIDGAERVRLQSIDESGSVIGTYRDIDTRDEVAFVMSPTAEVTELEMPENWDGWIYAANDSGDLVVALRDGPALLQGGQVEALEFPDASGALLNNVELNNVQLTEDGTVVGYFRDEDRDLQSFVHQLSGTPLVVDITGSRKTEVRSARDGIYAGSWIPEGSYEDAFILLPTAMCVG